MPLALIDTNVLIYAIDGRNRTRQARAIDVIQRLEATRLGRLSSQCLSEFVNATTRKIAPLLTWRQAATRIQELMDGFEVFPVAPRVVLTAVRGAEAYKLAYYDAQLWATALLNQVPMILSEDFASGSSIEGVRFVNPFDEKFVLADWA